VNNGRGKTHAKDKDSELGQGAQKNPKRSACEELTQCGYSKVGTVTINCNSA
jgi:hypothetical protein